MLAAKVDRRSPEVQAFVAVSGSVSIGRSLVHVKALKAIPHTLTLSHLHTKEQRLEYICCKHGTQPGPADAGELSRLQALCEALLITEPALCVGPGGHSTA